MGLSDDSDSDNGEARYNNRVKQSGLLSKSSSSNSIQTSISSNYYVSDQLVDVLEENNQDLSNLFSTQYMFLKKTTAQLTKILKEALPSSYDDQKPSSSKSSETYKKNTFLITETLKYVDTLVSRFDETCVSLAKQIDLISINKPVSLEQVNQYLEECNIGPINAEEYKTLNKIVSHFTITGHIPAKTIVICYEAYKNEAIDLRMFHAFLKASGQIETIKHYNTYKKRPDPNDPNQIMLIKSLEDTINQINNFTHFNFKKEEEIKNFYERLRGIQSENRNEKIDELIGKCLSKDSSSRDKTEILNELKQQICAEEISEQSIENIALENPEQCKFPEVPNNDPEFIPEVSSYRKDSQEKNQASSSKDGSLKKPKKSQSYNNVFEIHHASSENYSKNNITILPGMKKFFIAAVEHRCQEIRKRIGPKAKHMCSEWEKITREWRESAIKAIQYNPINLKELLTVLIPPEEAIQFKPHSNPHFGPGKELNLDLIHLVTKTTQDCHNVTQQLMQALPSPGVQPLTQSFHTTLNTWKNNIESAMTVLNDYLKQVHINKETDIESSMFFLFKFIKMKEQSSDELKNNDAQKLREMHYYKLYKEALNCQNNDPNSLMNHFKNFKDKIAESIAMHPTIKQKIIARPNSTVYEEIQHRLYYQSLRVQLQKAWKQYLKSEKKIVWLSEDPYAGPLTTRSILTKNLCELEQEKLLLWVENNQKFFNNLFIRKYIREYKIIHETLNNQNHSANTPKINKSSKNKISFKNVPSTSSKIEKKITSPEELSKYFEQLYTLHQQFEETITSSKELFEYLEEINQPHNEEKLFDLITNDELKKTLDQYDNHLTEYNKKNQLHLEKPIPFSAYLFQQYADNQEFIDRVNDSLKQSDTKIKELNEKILTNEKNRETKLTQLKKCLEQNEEIQKKLEKGHKSLSTTNSKKSDTYSFLIKKRDETNQTLKNIGENVEKLLNENDELKEEISFYQDKKIFYGKFLNEAKKNKNEIDIAIKATQDTWSGRGHPFPYAVILKSIKNIKTSNPASLQLMDQFIKEVSKPENQLLILDYVRLFSRESCKDEFKRFNDKQRKIITPITSNFYYHPPKNSKYDRYRRNIFSDKKFDPLNEKQPGLLNMLFKQCLNNPRTLQSDCKNLISMFTQSSYMAKLSDINYLHSISVQKIKEKFDTYGRSASFKEYTNNRSKKTTDQTMHNLFSQTSFNRNNLPPGKVNNQEKEPQQTSKGKEKKVTPLTCT